MFFENSKEFYLSFNEGNLMKEKENYFLDYKNLDVNDLNLNHTKSFHFSNRINDVCFLDIDTKIVNDF